MNNVKLNVKGMSCGHCVYSIEKALTAAGVNGQADLKSNTVSVDYDENKISLESIKEVIADQGYDVL